MHHIFEKKYSFEELQEGLQAQVKDRHVNRQIGKTGLELYNYSPQCIYAKAWNDFTIAARGIILHPPTRKVVAIPFPKFFNYGEMSSIVLPDLPFRVTEKMDGSLGIIYHWDDKWNVATRGSMASKQSIDASNMLSKMDLDKFDKDITYLAEIIYPDNRIVINYGSFKGLVFLSGYNRNTGIEVDREHLSQIVDGKVSHLVNERKFTGLNDLLILAKTIPESEEGFVVRFDNGLRVKIKGDAYCRIHRLISGVTPLNLWEILMKGDDVEAILKDLPEEFRVDYDNIVKLLISRRDALLAELLTILEETRELTDKELGLMMPELQKRSAASRFLYSWRRGKNIDTDPVTKRGFYMMFRPAGNVLVGYEPTSVMNRFETSEQI